MSEYIPAGGSVEVLLTQIRVIDRSTPSEWLDADGASLERAQRNIKAHRELGFKLQYEIRELVDIAHVTRLTADNARLRASEAKNIESADRHHHNWVEVCKERDALKTKVGLLTDMEKLTRRLQEAAEYELTKVRELMRRVTAYGREHFDLNDTDAASMEIREYLAHQSAPAAKEAIKFVSIEESLPPLNVEVLIRIPVLNKFNVESGTYQGDGNWIGAWYGGRGVDYCYKVSHWAPMPEVD